MKMYVAAFFLWVVISLGTVANAQSDPIKIITRDDMFLEILDRLKEGDFEGTWGYPDDGVREVLNLLKKNGFELLESNGVLGIPPNEAMVEPLTKLLQYYETTYSIALENLENPPIRMSLEGEVPVHQRRYAKLRENGEFEVLVDDRPGQLIFSPDHSGANAKGMLRLGNVGVTRECDILQEAYQMRLFVSALIDTVQSSR